jgi:uncharacterized membrane protein
VNELQKPRALYVLAALLFLEAIAVAGGAVYLVVETVLSTPTYYATSVALAVVAVIAAVGLFLVARFTLLGRPWIRGAAICWQIIQVLVAVSILQASAPDVAWILIVPAVIIIVLLFTKSVMAATSRPATRVDPE